MEKLKKLTEGHLFYFLSGAAALLVLYTRRPDAFRRPQFWAEDGLVWYAQAYNRGALYSLTTPEAGYFQTVSRLVAIFSQAFPLDYAPLIFNLSAIAAKLLVVLFLLSKRTDNFLPAVWLRLLAAAIYLALPHSYETHANPTNVQWHLALLSCLIVVAAPPATRAGRVFDGAAVLVSALSGPFCLLLLPVAALRYRRDRERHTLHLLAILTLGCLVQGTSLLLTERPSRAPLGANINLLLRILGGHLFVAALFGQAGLEWTIERPFWKDGVAVITNLFGLIMLAAAFRKASFELRLLLVFAALIVAGAFLSPAISSQQPQWEIMRYALVGSRYWTIPIFAFLLALVWLAREQGPKFWRGAACALLALAPVGMYNDWHYLPFKDLNFPQHAAEFENAPRGREVVIPINPDWEMRLTKK